MITHIFAKHNSILLNAYLYHVCMLNIFRYTFHTNSIIYNSVFHPKEHTTYISQNLSWNSFCIQIKAYNLCTRKFNACVKLMISQLDMLIWGQSNQLFISDMLLLAFIYSRAYFEYVCIKRSLNGVLLYYLLTDCKTFTLQ